MAYSSSGLTALGIGATSSDYDTEWSPDLDADDLRELQEAQNDPSKIIFDLPRESARLGFFSTLCLIFNRMIGTGVFNSSSIVFLNTQSIGLSLLLWVFGAILALAGVVVYVELGLSIPRWPLGRNGEKVSTPRSGEALNYFNYMLKKPAFLATCIFGINYIILENTAANSVSFAANILDAAVVKQTPGKIIAIALSVNTFCCLLHALSRKWGIYLNNFFGTTKLLMLLFIVILGLVKINKNVAAANYSPSSSFNFDHSPRLPYRYAEAFLYIIYPYGGFHQINYVISEFDQPRKNFPRGSWWGVMIVAIMYTATQMIFAAIIPKELLFGLTKDSEGGIDVGKEFFLLTLGKNTTVTSIWSVIKAYSAIGNIIVVTFTAARVKQEIAKEGILPYSLVFAQSYHFDLSFLWGKKPSKPNNAHGALYAEKTPIATLILHWCFTTIMVLGPVLAIKPKPPYNATAAQGLLAGIFAYDIDLICFTVIAFGLLCLRFTPRVRWAEKSDFKSPVVSVTAALILLISVLFPLILLWVPDPKAKFVGRTKGLVRWFSTQTAAMGLLSFSLFYWLCFRAYIHIRSKREGKTLYVRREPKFKHDAGGLTQILEIVTLEWKRDVGLRLDEIEEVDDGFRSPSASVPSAPTEGSRYRTPGGRRSPGMEEGRYGYLGKKPEMYELPVPERYE